MIKTEINATKTLCKNRCLKRGTFPIYKFTKIFHSFVSLIIRIVLPLQNIQTKIISIAIL